jgi:hypothetical protein
MRSCSRIASVLFGLGLVLQRDDRLVRCPWRRCLRSLLIRLDRGIISVVLWVGLIVERFAQDRGVARNGARNGAALGIARIAIGIVGIIGIVIVDLTRRGAGIIALGAHFGGDDIAIAVDQNAISAAVARVDDIRAFRNVIKDFAIGRDQHDIALAAVAELLRSGVRCGGGEGQHDCRKG